MPARTCNWHSYAKSTRLTLTCSGNWCRCYSWRILSDLSWSLMGGRTSSAECTASFAQGATDTTFPTRSWHLYQNCLTMTITMTPASSLSIKSCMSTLWSRRLISNLTSSWTMSVSSITLTLNRIRVVGPRSWHMGTMCQMNTGVSVKKQLCQDGKSRSKWKVPKLGPSNTTK